MDFKSKILARESSVGQSSRIFYRQAEGVPFKWEMQPGTPKHPQEDDVIPPLSPSPLMQSLGLPLPNLDIHNDDDHKETSLKSSKFWGLRKMVLGRRNKQQRESTSSFGDFKDISSFSSNSNSFSSFSSNNRFVDANNSGFDGPFCCSPWNVPAILDEGNTRIYYCSHHKTAFSVEKNSTFPTRILSRASSVEQFSGLLKDEISPAGIPFRWEEQPGTPKSTPPENELIIPPPSPPLAVQSLSLPQSRRHPAGGVTDDDDDTIRKTKWARFWPRRGNKKKENGKTLTQHEISFRHHDDESSSEELEVDEKSAGSTSFLRKDGWRVSKIKRSFQGSYFMSCGPAWSRRDVLVLVRTKFKSFTS